MPGREAGTGAAEGLGLHGIRLPFYIVIIYPRSTSKVVLLQISVRVDGHLLELSLDLSAVAVGVLSETY